MPMQMGEIPAIWATASMLDSLIIYKPQADFRAGIAAFCAGIGTITGSVKA